ncbi:MAG: 16S rRNA (adenine(1518)-N(6)/adenine(1519)-N(6))-dimethyltransferase RsmA [Firmicutes bacterium]|nr:16S rRNA (adenine(1518)-N(6)/adenine(1519)-N(6))-dimethyltransferase RsmA [Bacillota bacterium]
MDGPQLTSPRLVREILQRHKLVPNKGLGQNFLIDKNILAKIIAAVKIKPEDTILEVGPGLGVLTSPLAARAGRVVAVEVDKGLIPPLRENLGAYPNVKIVQGDILKISLASLVEDINTPLKVVANLPYYITSAVIMTLLTGPLNLQCMVLMVQREVAQRLLAVPGTKDYGILTAAVGYYTVPEIIAPVPRTVFYPSPAVDSAVVRLRVRESPPVEVEDEGLFFRLIRGAFGQRRKTLLNSLGGEFKGEYTREELARFLLEAQIGKKRRGETLNLEEFARLERIIKNRGKK